MSSGAGGCAVEEADWWGNVTAYLPASHNNVYLVSAPECLSRLVTWSGNSWATDLTALGFWYGDMDGNNSIGGTSAAADEAVYTAAAGAEFYISGTGTQKNTRYNLRADLNRNGVVDQADSDIYDLITASGSQTGDSLP